MNLQLDEPRWTVVDGGSTRARKRHDKIVAFGSMTSSPKI